MEFSMALEDKLAGVEVELSPNSSSYGQEGFAAAQYDDEREGETAQESPALPALADGRNDVPQWVFEKTKAGKGRRRLPLACLLCRKKKIKCSGEKPTCLYCQKSGLFCEYVSATRRKRGGAAPTSAGGSGRDSLDQCYSGEESDPGRPGDAYAEACAPAERALEYGCPSATVAGIPNGTVPAPVPAHVPTLATSSHHHLRVPGLQQQQHLSGPMPDSGLSVSLPTPLPTAHPHAPVSTLRVDHTGYLNEWARDYAGPTPAFGGGSDESYVKPLLRSQQIVDTREDRHLLPSIHVQMHLSDVFFRTIHGGTYYLVQRDKHFQALMDKTASVTLVLAICAVSARFSNLPELASEPKWAAGEEFADKALRLVLTNFDQPSLDNVAALVIMALHNFGACHGNKSWMLAGMAMRMACALRLNDEVPLAFREDCGTYSAQDVQDDEMRRRIFFSCFILDRFNSSSAGRPHFLLEEDCAVQLPVEESTFWQGVPAATERVNGELMREVPEALRPRSSNEHMGVLAYSIKIILLWGRVVQYVSKDGMLEEGPRLFTRESTYERLDASVMHFMETLPERLRWRSEALHMYTARGEGSAFVLLHVACHQVLLFLHRWCLHPEVVAGPPDMVERSRKIAEHSANRISAIAAEAFSHGVNITSVPFMGYSVFTASCVHIHDIFGHDLGRATVARQHLQSNINILTDMKAYWGVMQNMANALNDMLHQQMRACVGSDIAPPSGDKGFLFYSDWFDKYPNERTDRGPDAA